VQICYRYLIVIVDSLHIIIGYKFANSHKFTLEIIVGEMNFNPLALEMDI